MLSALLGGKEYAKFQITYKWKKQSPTAVAVSLWVQRVGYREV